jgi:hypothetical protein
VQYFGSAQFINKHQHSIPLHSRSTARSNGRTKGWWNEAGGTGCCSHMPPGENLAYTNVRQIKNRITQLHVRDAETKNRVPDQEMW